MSDSRKGIVALSVFVIILLVGADVLPADRESTMGTVIHKTLLEVSPEDAGERAPSFVILVWEPSHKHIFMLKCTQQQWQDFHQGDKLMIYRRRGWITNFTYSVTVQNGYQKITLKS